MVEKVVEKEPARCTRHPKGEIFFHSAAYYGLGYPPGYGPDSIDDICANGEVFRLLAIGGDGFKIRKVIPQVWDETHLTVECTEFGYGDVETVLGSYFKKTIKWGSGKDGPINAEEEFKSWQKDQEKHLDWLARGAPPYALVISDSAIDSDETGIMKSIAAEKGYKRIKGGWKIEATKVIDMPKKTFERKALNYAKQQKISGAVYVSSGSWPLPIRFVADGKRYMTHAAFDENGEELFVEGRAWFAYYGQARLARVFPQAGEAIDIFVKSGEPDVLPAMRKIQS